MIKWNINEKGKYSLLNIKRFWVDQGREGHIFGTLWLIYICMCVYYLVICIYMHYISISIYLYNYDSGDALESVLLALFKENLVISYINFTHRKMFSKRIFPPEIIYKINLPLCILPSVLKLVGKCHHLWKSITLFVLITWNLNAHTHTTPPFNHLRYYLMISDVEVFF